MVPKSIQLSWHSLIYNQRNCSEYENGNVNYKFQQLVQYIHYFLLLSANPNLLHHQSNMNDLAQAQYVPQHPGYNYGYPACHSFTARPHYGKTKSDVRDKYDVNGVPRRRPGRPRIKSIPTEEELAAQREKKCKNSIAVTCVKHFLLNYIKI